jgi:hypothetical protein
VRGCAWKRPANDARDEVRTTGAARRARVLEDRGPRPAHPVKLNSLGLPGRRRDPNAHRSAATAGGTATATSVTLRPRSTQQDLVPAAPWTRSERARRTATVHGRLLAYESISAARLHLSRSAASAGTSRAFVPSRWQSSQRAPTAECSDCSQAEQHARSRWRRFRVPRIPASAPAARCQNIR